MSSQPPPTSRLSESPTPRSSDPLAQPSFSPTLLPEINDKHKSSSSPKAQVVYKLLLDGADDATNPEGAADDDASSTSSTTTPCCNFVTAGAIANLCSATLGAGVLALPFGISECGIVVGIFLLLASAAATVVSIQLIAQACEHYQYFSYEALCEHLYGPRLRFAVEAAVLVFCSGCATAYIVTMADILQTCHLLLQWHHVPSRTLSSLVVWCVVLLPLSLLRRIQSLSWASGMGVASIGTLVFACTVHWIDPTLNDAPDSSSSWLDDVSDEGIVTPTTRGALFYQALGDTATSSGTGWKDSLWPVNGWISVLQACPIILFAFSCQVNVCQIYQELGSSPSDSTSPGNNRPAMMKRVAVGAVVLCWSLYLSISLVALGDESVVVQPNLLTSYEIQGILQVASGAMATAVMVAFPLNIFPARITLTQWWNRQANKRRNRSNEAANETLTAALLEDTIETPTASNVEMNEAGIPSPQNDETSPQQSSIVVEESERSDQDDWSLGQHVLLTVVLAGLALGLALVAPNISVVFGLLGGTTSSLLGFCVPGLLGIRLAQDTRQHGHLRLVSWMLLVGGIVVGVLTTAVTIYTLF